MQAVLSSPLKVYNYEKENNERNIYVQYRRLHLKSAARTIWYDLFGTKVNLF